MNDRFRRIYEAGQRVLAFITANLAAFSDIPLVEEIKLELTDAVVTLENLGADKATKTGAALDKTLNRGDARQNVIDQMRNIADMWKRIAPKTGGDVNKFRKPRGGDSDTIAAAASFAQQLPAVKIEFTKRGFPDGFIEDLQTAAADFSELVNESESARRERVGTNAAFDAPVKTCKDLIEDLDPIVRLKFSDNAQKLAEWLVASHVERAPKPSTAKSPPSNP